MVERGGKGVARGQYNDEMGKWEGGGGKRTGKKKEGKGLNTN